LCGIGYERRCLVYRSIVKDTQAQDTLLKDVEGRLHTNASIEISGGEVQASVISFQPIVFK
jgi:hypothetical protein